MIWPSAILWWEFNLEMAVNPCWHMNSTFAFLRVMVYSLISTNRVIGVAAPKRAGSWEGALKRDGSWVLPPVLRCFLMLR